MAIMIFDAFYAYSFIACIAEQVTKRRWMIRALRALFNHRRLTKLH